MENPVRDGAPPGPEAAPPELAGCTVVSAYPPGSRDIQSSVARVPGYTAEIQALGVTIVGVPLSVTPMNATETPSKVLTP